MTLSILFIAISYLMGSICSAIIVCRTFDLPDPRENGSKNPGATNVLRVAGKPYAALVLLVDILKGTIPVLIAKALGASPTVLSVTVLAAVIGHMYPIFFGFRGGKGVATAIGALLGFQFIVGVMVTATWLLVANFSRISSLASIVSITLAPIYALLVIQQIDIFTPLFFMVLLIIYKHKNNLTRLVDGVEPQIILKNSVIEEIMEAPESEDIIKEEEEPTAEKNKTHKAAPKKASEKKPAKAKNPKTSEPTKPIKKATKTAAKPKAKKTKE